MTELKVGKSFKDGLQFAWNSSSITVATECLYKYKLQVLDGWGNPRPSVHLIFGGHYATALEHFHKHVAEGKTWQEALREVVREALVNSWVPEHKCERCDGKELYMETDTVYCEACGGTGWIEGKPQLFDHNTKTRENLIRSIVWYVDQFHDEPMTVMRDRNGAPLVEHTGVLQVDNDILFTCHLDSVVEYAHDPYIRDQKTTGSTITPRYFDGYKPDIQMSMYTFMGKALFNIPVKGVIIDAAQIAVGFTRFERGFTFRTESELSEWYDDTLRTIETARRATQENYFPRNTTSCGNYGGCPFRGACSRSPEVREQFLKADFVKGARLDPLDIR